MTAEGTCYEVTTETQYNNRYFRNRKLAQADRYEAAGCPKAEPLPPTSFDGAPYGFPGYEFSVSSHGDRGMLYYEMQRRAESEPEPVPVFRPAPRDARERERQRQRSLQVAPVPVVVAPARGDHLVRGAATLGGMAMATYLLFRLARNSSCAWGTCK